VVLVLVLLGLMAWGLNHRDPARPAYAGPLVVDGPNGAAGSAAAAVVECDGEVVHAFPRPGQVSAFNGLDQGQGSPEESLQAQVAQSRSVPHDGYRVARSTADRVLFTFDVEGRARVAYVVAKTAVVRNPPTWIELKRDGWIMESAAWCDQSEFPASVDDDIGREIWTDREGHRQPTKRIYGSVVNVPHCGWHDMTFLYLDHRDDTERQYVRDPGKRLPAGALRSTYTAYTSLPENARDTGLRRDGRELWLTDEAAYVVKGGDVARWPRTKFKITCA
jgi:hypothetical protein